MYTITIILITLFIPMIQCSRPTLKLTFTPDTKYMTVGQELDIKCEILNPSDPGDVAQLFYYNLHTNKDVLVSRQLLTSPTVDAPEVFKKGNHRYSFKGKSHIHMKDLQAEDSARYQCDCPDCMDPPPSPVSRNVSVMTLSDPKWIVGPGWPLHEDIKANLTCRVDNFFPYVGHKILHDHVDITNEGKSSLPAASAHPQTFIWEASLNLKANWHNSTLQCIVIQGNVEKNATKVIEILFAPRFDKCAESQFVDSQSNQSSIECSYSGNPQPTLTWVRQRDKKPLTPDMGITMQVKNESYGKYRSILTFNREKLVSMPLVPATGTDANKTEENFYQQLLNDGFIAQLSVNGNEKGKRIITIVRDANQIRSLPSIGSTIYSFSSMFLSFLLFVHIHQR